MASPSSFASRNYRFNVFPSFRGEDVRKSFLGHLRKQFNYNGITMFDDKGIERSDTISPSLIQAIRQSRISIVILSKNYASSSWCLNELVEILECKKAMGLIVMTIFYGVDPSHVRKQTGHFGSAFNETCLRKTDEERRKWSRALTDVSNILGEDFLNWDSEANMIEKIAGDVSRKLNASPSKDFEDMVGLSAHLNKMKYLLSLDNEDGAMIVGVCGPAGIGKTTIARALHSQLSSSFQLSCFIENLRGSYSSGLDDYGLKLCLQEQLLSKILNQNGIKISHLGALEERLHDQKVLIILDDVNDLKQLEALASETRWFGSGSRIIVTTEDQELLQQHGIDNTYHVGFPSKEEALGILCRYAFKQSSPHHGFKELALRVTKLCGNLPLGLRVVGSSLRGKKEREWEEVSRRLETILDQRDIEEVLRVGYESLHEYDKSLFLHIAVFFNYKDANLVIAMLADNNMDIKHGLKILVNKSLIYITTRGEIVMHNLLQQVGRQAIHRQEPWKRQVLIDAHEICDVLENDTGTRAVSGISFDTSGINEVIISDRALRRMRHLRFLCVYKTRYDGNDSVHIPEKMEFPPHLRLLHWEEYPRKSLPLRFSPENLVELCMPRSQLENLWEGTQPLTNLKKMDLSWSEKLKELPNLSNATSLKRLQLSNCMSLVELPSSIGNLHKLQDLVMNSCVKLEVIPTHINLASLERIYMIGCSRLRNFPDISTNICQLLLSQTAIEEVPASIRSWSRLSFVDIRGSGNLKTITHFPESLWSLDLSYTDIEKIPGCIKGIHQLQSLEVTGCKKLAFLPELPCSLRLLMAEDCESMERFACLPGKQVPSEFNHRTKGDSLTILQDKDCLFSSVSSKFKVCVVISPKKHQETRENRELRLKYGIIGKSGYRYPIFIVHPREAPGIRTEHLCIFHCDFPEEDEFSEVDSKILFEFSSRYCEIIECGVQILTKEVKGRSNGSNEYGLDHVSEDKDDWSYEFEPQEVFEDSDNSDCSNGLIRDSKSDKATDEEEEEEEDNVQGKEHTRCWSFLFICFDLSHIVRNIGSFCWGTR
ncbi:hypothetical protein EUTSA_v10018052mg [Eutrema salsugineum]|uniref:ADP-ribosyl cyclase/cyclic ADP-ribose hydrolase n=1 Tax=Eutrema salsugineum TaxID=72664 RepID=V4KBN9_EUTSA|nr:hypothetical protein EUTSA_v10018052mg [Eutrema salsugineum]